jgi:hypothetical protein
VTLLPAVPTVLFDLRIVTRPVPVLLTVPVTVLFVNVTVIGVLVLNVRFSVIVMPVKAAGVAWFTEQSKLAFETPTPLRVIGLALLQVLTTELPTKEDDLMTRAFVAES